jgi:hypothetical protein
MFFVRGLSSKGNVVLVNPDQVIYVRAAGFRHNKAALVLTHGKRLIVDQNTSTVGQRFEDYLKHIGEICDASASNAGKNEKAHQCRRSKDLGRILLDS